MRKLGVPYEEGYEAIAEEDLKVQAKQIAATLKAEKIEVSENKEIIALIAYLQRLGRDIQTAIKKLENEIYLLSGKNS